jgi:hypothetical protein
VEIGETKIDTGVGLEKEADLAHGRLDRLHPGVRGQRAVVDGRFERQVAEGRQRAADARQRALDRVPLVGLERRPVDARERAAREARLRVTIQESGHLGQVRGVERPRPGRQAIREGQRREHAADRLRQPTDVLPHRQPVLPRRRRGNAVALEQALPVLHPEPDGISA